MPFPPNIKLCPHPKENRSKIYMEIAMIILKVIRLLVKYMSVEMFVIMNQGHWMRARLFLIFDAFCY